MSPPVNSTIEISLNGDMLEAHPRLLSEAPLNINYIFITAKSGRSGHTQSQQRGHIVLLPKRPACPSGGLWLITPGDQYQFDLRIYHDGKLIAEQTRHVASH